MMPIRALLVEDDDTDAMFLRAQAGEETPHGRVVLERVTRLADAIDHLEQQTVDVVLLDLGLPDSQGLATLHRLRDATSAVPVVVLTGTDDQALAQQAMEDGAQDFFRKDQLSSLPVAQLLRHAVDRHRLQRQLLQSEQRFRTLVELSDDALSRLRVHPKIEFEYVSPSIQEITGIPPAALLADPDVYTDRVHPDDLEAFRDGSAVRAGRPYRVVYRWQRDDGTWAWLEDRRTPIMEDGRLVVVQAITRDLSPMKQAELALQDALAQERAALDKLRNLDELKTSFLQAVSHELRTPLTVIHGISITLSQRGMHLSEDQRSLMTARLAVAAERLQRLLADLLDVDRLNRGLLTVERRPVELGPLVAAVLEDMDRNAHPVTLTCPDDLVAMLDGPKVARIIENLVQNAIKHTPPGTNVAVVVTGDEERLRLTVVDDGPGVDDETAGRLFEPFSQGRLAREHPSPGTGIGLTLVARYAQLHGGRAWLESKAPSGAHFVVELPRGGGHDSREDSAAGPGPDDGAPPPPAPTPGEGAADVVDIRRATDLPEGRSHALAPGDFWVSGAADA